MRSNKSFRRFCFAWAWTVACVLGLASSLGAQQLGAALWNQGYTRTLYLEAVSHQLTVGPFNPNAVAGADRYGPAIDWHFSFGNTVGERASCETVDRYVAAGLLPGLGAGYHCTQFDLGDAKLLTRSGQRAAYDDMLSALGSQQPPVEPPPSPPTCPAGKSCLAPGEDCPAPPPVQPCPEPPSCPACPPVVTCPPVPPPVVCPDLSGVPVDIVPLLRQIATYSVIGPGRRNQILRILHWAETLEAVEVVKP